MVSSKGRHGFYGWPRSAYELAQKATDFPIVRNPESRAGRPLSTRHRRARRRQCSEEILVGTVVADGRQETIRDRLGVNALSEESLADAPKPDFDHLPSLDPFEGLIAQRVAKREQLMRSMIPFN
jgi:hypothetical protein